MPRSNRPLWLAVLAGAALAAAAPAGAATYRVVYGFQGGNDGAGPTASLVNAGGILYGTTTQGGASGNGTVFKVNPGTGAGSVVHAFQGGTDGAYPTANLLNVGGTLYGTTAYGGGVGCEIACGTVFTVNRTTGATTVVQSFRRSGLDSPRAGLINVNGTLYGTTLSGSAASNGAVFKFIPGSGPASAVYALKGGPTDGASPYASVLNVGGTLWGTTLYGGAFRYGAVYKLNPGTGVESLVYSFKGGADGAYPEASLINVGGALYGITNLGGGSNLGTVFKLNPKTGEKVVVHSFQGGATDGAIPKSRLLNVGGMLYGTTSQGGGFGCESSGCGTIFRIDPASGAYGVVYAFQGGRDGAIPVAGLINAGGTLYGTTQYGGGTGCGAGCGTVFAFTP